MKKTLFIMLFISIFFHVKAQRFDKIAERLDKLEKNNKIDKSLLTTDLSGKKFAYFKNVNKIIYKNILEINANNKITLIKITDDKQTDEKTSKIYFGDLQKKENYISIRADQLEEKRIDLPYTLNFYLQKRDGVLCLINLSNNEIWYDTDASKK